MDLQTYLLSQKTIRFKAVVANWQEAVKIGTNLLEASASVTKQYYTEILNSVDKLGPYFVIAPGIAMPHARPEGGVLANGFALVTLKTPVNFGDKDNDPVDILLTLAAVDAKTQNEKAIVQVIDLFDNNENIRKLRSANSLEDLANIFKQQEE